MPLTDAIPDLLSTCHVQLGRLLESFDSGPSSQGLSEIGTVAEVLVLAEPAGDTSVLIQLLSDAAAKWLRDGILEDLCFSRAELGYYAALLAFMAQRSSDFSVPDMAIFKRLCRGRIIGRSEMPVLNQQLVASYLTRCGAGDDFGDAGERDLAQLVDKKVLRARSDEFDIQCLLMCAQLMQLECPHVYNRPAIYPRALLVHALRTNNVNWVPVLTYLCTRWFPLEDILRASAIDYFVKHLPAPGELLPAPESSGLDKDHISKSSRGLRIRSTVALILSLCTLGVNYVEDRDCQVVC